MHEESGGCVPRRRRTRTNNSCSQPQLPERYFPVARITQARSAGAPRLPSAKGVGALHKILILKNAKFPKEMFVQL